ncbi:cell envelope integrity protein CreD [Apibacter raozihei]|uniref:cell envelope integrity protein CreD n=1 Tax=Apibacter raozihei TaxID=2500547 RepID=UPI000FE2B83A|nr:cell envelope integrity protein CreD [Apibacter raozihei]
MENQENQLQEHQKPLDTVKKKDSENSNSIRKKITESVMLKGVVVVLLIFIMLLPTPFIINLIGERKERKEKIVKDESRRFGGNQTLCGPYLKLPYQKKDSLGRITLYYRYLSPKEVKVKGKLNPLPKHRGLYDIVMYKAQLTLEANFESTDYASLQKDSNNYLWNEAEMVFGVSDTKGWEGDLNFRVNNTTIPVQAGEGFSIEELVTSKETPHYQTQEMEELKIPVHLNPEKNVTVSLPMTFNGAGELNFIPVSKNMQIDISTAFKDLKFTGEASPSENETGNLRNLHWKVSSLRMETLTTQFSDYGKNKFGITIIQPNNDYGKTNRVAKYSVLFIGLTFITFFFIEIINKLKIHPVQYVLVGLALSIFYLLLLSLSEYLGFNLSYIVSSLATTLLICWFIKGIVKSLRITGIVFVVLLLVYTYIFIIIQLDELALLAGSCGLFIILALLMYFSRKIDWKNL